MAKPANLKEIIQYFGTPERPVTPVEFKRFWEELPDSEREFYKNGVGNILGHR